MRKFRKKPIIVEAEQWFKNGDVSEEKTVPFDRDPLWTCDHCGHTASEHNNCPTLEGFHIVCPGDWIIKGIAGEFYPCKDSIFRATYEAMETK